VGVFIAIALLLLNQATADRQTQGLQALDRHD
jgi:hypothetical protein